MKETPSQLPLQSYVMNFPFTLSTSDPNNIWMQELSDEDLTINKPKAYKQFMDLYNFMSGQSLVYLLPSEGNFQDQVYVANLGLQLPHLKDRNVVLLSNYTSDPRKGEELVGKKFFDIPILRYPPWFSIQNSGQYGIDEVERCIKYMEENVQGDDYLETFEGFKPYELLKIKRDLAIMKESLPPDQLLLNKKNYYMFITEYAIQRKPYLCR